MILRRITGHLKQQHWTAIGIELGIVVLGVFIGMQVSNWKEARIEQARTTLVLDAFRADMRDYIRVQQRFGEKSATGFAAFDAARSRGERPAPFFMRLRGSDTAPKSVWEVAHQCGLTELVEKEILPRTGDLAAFYDDKGNLKPEYQQNMERLREWKADGAVTAVSAGCLLKRFETPKLAGPSCRANYGNFVHRQPVK